jgi:hypothetical protein
MSIIKFLLNFCLKILKYFLHVLRLNKIKKNKYNFVILSRCLVLSN